MKRSLIAVLNLLVVLVGGYLALISITLTHTQDEAMTLEVQFGAGLAMPLGGVIWWRRRSRKKKRAGW